MKDSKRRGIKVLLLLAGILAGGLFFAYGAAHWGWWLPCIFNQITGLKCPGCGVSRMCLALLRLDFSRAFYWNPAVLSCLPILAYLIGYLSYRYIRYGDMQLKKWQQRICWVMIGVLLVFGALRNLS